MNLKIILQASGTPVSDVELHAMMSEVDVNKNGQVELEEYLELMTAMKIGTVSSNRLARVVEQEYEKSKALNQISVERSGGGL